MYPKLERSAIERHPVFCPSANSWSTSGSEASLSEPLIAMLAVLLDQAVGDVRPIPHHLLAALHPAQARHDDPAGAHAARAPRLARLPLQHVAGQPGGERHVLRRGGARRADRKSTRLNSSHLVISYAVFCLKKKKT